MAEGTQKDAAKSSTEDKSVDEEPTFSHEDLIRRAHRAVGHAPNVIAGALSTVQKKHLTVEEAQEACEKFLGRKDSTVKDATGEDS